MQVLRRLVVAAFAVLLVFPAAHVPASAEPPTVLYRLGGASAFLSGCIEGPCLCPIAFTYMAGTFGLTADPAGGPGAYAISDIAWFTHGNGEIHGAFTGSGSYFVAGEEHRIVLDLVREDGTPVSIDSGFVVRGSEFPEIAISGLTSSLCFQEGVDLVAGPSAATVDVAMPAATDLVWSVVPDATGYDVVHGDLELLRESGGAYAYAGTLCLAADVTVTAAIHQAMPAPGQAVWFLVRGRPGPGYDSGGSGQAEPRDGEIAAAPGACP